MCLGDWDGSAHSRNDSMALAMTGTADSARAAYPVVIDRCEDGCPYSEAGATRRADPCSASSGHDRGDAFSHGADEPNHV